MFDLNSVFEKKKKKKIAYLAILRTINSLERVWNLCKTKEEEKKQNKTSDWMQLMAVLCDVTSLLRYLWQCRNVLCAMGAAKTRRGRKCLWI